MDSRLPKLVFVLLVLGGTLYFSFLYPQLPERMASHFNASGAATAWMPKSSFFVFFPIVILAAGVPVFLVPMSMAKLPNEKFNMVNKEYWLAPERRAETIEYLGTQLGWFGCAVQALLFCGLYYAVAANLRPDHTFDSGSFYIALGAFSAFLIFWLVRLLSHFSHFPEQNARS